MVKSSLKLIDTITRLSRWIFDLENIIPSTFELYISNNIISAACERYFERIIEDLIMISNVILKDEGIVERSKCFELLFELGILNELLAKKLKKIKGMRNLMIHKYDSFDENLFYDNLRKLIIDSKKFISEITKNIDD